jgi:hypothetical protein
VSGESACCQEIGGSACASADARRDAAAVIDVSDEFQCRFLEPLGVGQRPVRQRARPSPDSACERVQGSPLKLSARLSVKADAAV